MNITNDLPSASVLLAMLMVDDPRLLLLRAVAWLDPNTLIGSDSDSINSDVDYDEADEIAVGMDICRACFPGVYAGAVQLQWQQASDPTIQRYLLDGINARLIEPLQDLDELRYGPILGFCGLNLQILEPEDADTPPWTKLLPVFALFDLMPDSDTADYDAAFAAAKALIVSLTPKQEVFYQNLTNLLMWMFSCSGNTAVDYTLEEFWENGYDTPSWSPDHVALVNDINQEADEIITSALSALDSLNATPPLYQAFSRNTKVVLKAVHKLWKGRSHDRHFTFSDDDAATISRSARWPDCP